MSSFLRTTFGTINLLALIAFIPPVDSSELELTRQTYNDLTNGRTVFLLFKAPWCGHCKELAPKWNRIADEWVNSNQVLIASVDCTKEEEFCLSLQIPGFPTLMYGDPSEGGIFLEIYTGNKEYHDLSHFANNTLPKPICSVGNPGLCNEAEQESIMRLWRMSKNDLEAAIKEKEGAINMEERNFQNAFEAMQLQYDSNSLDHEIMTAQMKSNIKLLKNLMTHQK